MATKALIEEQWGAKAADAAGMTELGANLYPRAVEVIMREHPEIDELQIHLVTAEGIRDEIEILAEITEGDPGALLSALGDDLADAHEGLRFGTRQVEQRVGPCTDGCGQFWLLTGRRTLARVRGTRSRTHAPRFAGGSHDEGDPLSGRVLREAGEPGRVQGGG